MRYDMGMDSTEVTALYSHGRLRYDEAGNLIYDRQGYAYHYDYENRLTKIQQDGSDIVEYTYDALGRRIEKKDHVTSANTRRYFYSKDWQVLDEYSGDATPVLKCSYLYGNYIDEVLLSWIGIPPNWRYYVHDHLYSVAAEINTSSAVTERYEYDAYGNPHVLDSNFADDADNLPDNDNPYLFTGRRVDYLNNADLILQYNRNRYYDYHTGRWLTHDPLGMNLDSYSGFKMNPKKQYQDALNLYQYSMSNSLRFTDPYGWTIDCPGGEWWFAGTMISRTCGLVGWHTSYLTWECKKRKHIGYYVYKFGDQVLETQKVYRQPKVYGVKRTIGAVLGLGGSYLFISGQVSGAPTSDDLTDISLASPSVSATAVIVEVGVGGAKKDTESGGGPAGGFGLSFTLLCGEFTTIDTEINDVVTGRLDQGIGRAYRSGSITREYEKASVEKWEGVPETERTKPGTLGTWREF